MKIKAEKILIKTKIRRELPKKFWDSKVQLSRLF